MTLAGLRPGANLALMTPQGDFSGRINRPCHDVDDVHDQLILTDDKFERFSRHVDNRFGRNGKRIGRLNQKVERLTDTLDALIDTVDVRLDGVDARLESVERELDEILRLLRGRPADQTSDIAPPQHPPAPGANT